VLLIIIGLVSGSIFTYNYFTKPRVIFEEVETALSCNDGDNGINIYRKATTTYTRDDPYDDEISTVNSPDWCEYNHPKTKNRVGLIREGSCEEEGKFKQVFMTCGRGYVCRDGACVEGDENLGVCSDTDGGTIPDERGEVQGYGGSGEDSCWVSFNTNPELDGGYGPDCSGEGCYIYEYYCEGDLKKYKIISCDNGCRDGACL